MRPPEASTESPLTSTLSLLSLIRYTETVPYAGAKEGNDVWRANSCIRLPFGRCPVYIMDNFVYSLKGQAAF